MWGRGQSRLHFTAIDVFWSERPMTPPLTLKEYFDLALVHHQVGRLTEAEALYRKILDVEPDNASALHHLGLIFYQRGRHEQASRTIQQAVSLNPTDAAAHSNLGSVLCAMNRFDEAIPEFRRALEIHPRYPEALTGLGEAYRQRGLLDAAAEACIRALQIRPNYPEALNNLGNAFGQVGRFDEAVRVYQLALQITPNSPETLNNLGMVLREVSQHPGFPASQSLLIASAKQSIGWADAESSILCANQGAIDLAVAALQRAIAIRPTYGTAYNNIGSAFKDQGRLYDAINAFRRARDLRPNVSQFQSNLIYTLQFHPGQDGTAIAEEERVWNNRFGQVQSESVANHTNTRDSVRRLRVGYISPDFREHVVGRNVWPLFEHHDRREFEIFCYACNLQCDRRTEAFRDRADRWQNAAGIRSEELSRTIRSDTIDILVDLSQHTANNLLPVFAHRPAPVQVSFAGYPETTGLETIGYRISDRWLEGAKRQSPDAADITWLDQGHERVYLIESFWCYDPCGMELTVNALPAKMSGQITFGSLNNFCKVNDLVLQLWARVLTRIENSRLILLSGFGSHRQRTIDFLAQHGVKPECVEFVAPCPRKDYLELYHRLDIGLDPFPYGGHTTSLDALWMGVPVVSLAGDRPVSRAGLSILNNLGLPELVTFSEDEYVEIAVKLANDLSRLTELRRTLRSRMENSVLTDGPHFARQIEAAYRAMWREWCAKQDSSSQAVP